MKRFLALFLAGWLLLAALPALGEAATPAPAFTGTPEEMLQQWYQLGAELKANGMYPFVVLKKGDTGYEVTALQTRLKELGYYQKEVVDNFGKGTYAALREFERVNGLTVDGEASVADQQALFAADAKVYVARSAPANNVSGNTADATSGATK